MKLNQAGIDLIKKFEGCRLKAYPDPGTNGEPYTIGYGHTGGVKLGDVMTQAQADSTLRLDLDKVCEQIKPCLKIQLNDNQFSALVVFVFNCGIGNFKSSTMLRLINSNKIQEAADQFEKWDKAAGKVMAGLHNRRLAEKTLYLS